MRPRGPPGARTSNRGTASLNGNLAPARGDRRRKATPKPLRGAPPPPPFGWSPSPALTRGGGKGGDASPPPWSECGMGEGDRPHRASKDARLSTGYEDGGGGRAATGLDSYDRPENLAQRLEKVESAPGIASAAMAGADAGPSIANVAAHGSRPRAATDCRCASACRGRGFRLPGRQATVARKIHRNALKRLNPRPELRRPRWLAWTRARQSRTSPPTGAGLEPRPIALLVRLRGRGFRLPGRQATLARKIRRNALKTLNPRPELRQPRWPARTPASQSRTSPPAGPGL